MRLLYGTGMRLSEGLSLRVKDVDFDRLVMVVGSGKGNNDRVVMLPSTLIPDLHQKLATSRALWAADLVGHSSVYMPMHSKPSTREPGRVGLGIGFSQFPNCR